MVCGEGGKRGDEGFLLPSFILSRKHKRSKKRGIAPQILYVERPDNPWRDRYLVCKDCERRVNYENKPPRSNCNNSTVMELDMTAQFSRDNVMVTSCELVQMVRDDVWVKYEKGTYARTDKKQAPAFPVQVCCVCRKTTLEEGRRFKVCPVCEGAAYCSESCFAEHNLKHQAGETGRAEETCFFLNKPMTHEGVSSYIHKLRTNFV